MMRIVDRKRVVPRHWKLAVFIMQGSWLAATELFACPLCKEAVLEPGQIPQRLATAKAYAVSIGLLLTMPALLLGGLIILMVRAQRLKGKDEPDRSTVRVDTSELAR